MHLVSKAIRDSECSMARVAGVSQILQPNLSINFAKAGMLSRDGYCHSFDASANGHVRGEGVDAVVLKSLEEAQRDGDNILAVLNGSAINQDGRSSDLMVLNGPSQKKVIRDALMDGSLIPADTGAPLGDSIEIKSNIGHLEGAAGIAGLISVNNLFDRGTAGQAKLISLSAEWKGQCVLKHNRFTCDIIAHFPELSSATTVTDLKSSLNELLLSIGGEASTTKTCCFCAKSSTAIESLSICGHSYCLRCFSDRIDDDVSQPLCCGDCNTPVSVKDIRVLVLNCDLWSGLCMQPSTKTGLDLGKMDPYI